MLDGDPIDKSLNLRFVCALNPYERHTDAMIERLEQAGLGYSVGKDNAREKIGGTPMRHLVYRVQPLPESLRHCVWDFGTLSAETENKYIRELVGTKLRPGLLGGSVCELDACPSVRSPGDGDRRPADGGRLLVFSNFYSRI